MPKSFGQFRAAQRERSLLTPEECGILRAFNQGANAGRADEPRHSPYRPESEQEKHQAWLLGFDEEATRYVLATPVAVSHTMRLDGRGTDLAEVRPPQDC